MSEKKIEDITTERGGDYGQPIDHFDTTRKMFDIFCEKRAIGRDDIPEELDNCVKHIAYLVLDKLTRLGQNPLKQDGWDDIQGYASLWQGCVEEYNRRNDENITIE